MKGRSSNRRTAAVLSNYHQKIAVCSIPEVFANNLSFRGGVPLATVTLMVSEL